MFCTARRAGFISSIRDVSTISRTLRSQSTVLSAKISERLSSILFPRTNEARRSLYMSPVIASSSIEEAKIDVKGANEEYKIPQHHPSKLDRFTLIFTRTMKAHEIGSEVSRDTMEKANTKRRIMVNVFLMVFTVFGSIYSIRRGKRDKKTDNIYEINKRR